MYCPRCGHQTISDELRFCSYCGLKLGVIKASLSECEDLPATTVSSVSAPPRQRDINIGVILMFGGAVVSTLLVDSGPGFGRTSGAVIMVLEYLLLLVLSLPLMKGILKLLSWESDTSVSSSRKGMGFGATGMFLSTFALALVSYYMFGRMKTNFFMVGLVAVFMLLLLIGRQFFRGLQYLVVDETAISSADTKPAIGATFESPALTTGQGTPIPIFGAQRVTTSEIVAPSSITEHTTNLLD